MFSNIAPQSSDRVVQVIGKEEQCIESLLEAIELIKGTPIKGPIHNYDPHNFDDVYGELIYFKITSPCIRAFSNSMHLQPKNMEAMELE